MTNNASKGSKIEKEALEDIVKVFDEHAARDRSKADYDTGEKADRDLATTVPVCIQVKGVKYYAQLRNRQGAVSAVGSFNAGPRNGHLNFEYIHKVLSWYLKLK